MYVLSNKTVIKSELENRMTNVIKEFYIIVALLNPSTENEQSTLLLYHVTSKLKS